MERIVVGEGEFSAFVEVNSTFAVQTFRLLIEHRRQFHLTLVPIPREGRRKPTPGLLLAELAFFEFSDGRLRMFEDLPGVTEGHATYLVIIVGLLVRQERLQYLRNSRATRGPLCLTDGIRMVPTQEPGQYVCMTCGATRAEGDSRLMGSV